MGKQTSVMEYYSEIRKNFKAFIYVITWINRQVIVLSERSKYKVTW